MSRVVIWRRTTYGLVVGTIMIGLGVFAILFAFSQAMYLEEETLNLLVVGGFCVMSGIPIVIVSAIQRYKEENPGGYSGYGHPRRKRDPVY